MARAKWRGKAVIHRAGATDDILTGRAGLAFFSRYLRGTEILSELGRRFASIRKNGKGQPVSALFHQILCFFMDGTSRHLVHFDTLKEDAGYAGAIETPPDQMASSHMIKRFFCAFRGPQTWQFRQVLQRMFLARLKLEKPAAIVLGIDTMVMNNDEAEKRHGVQPTYKRIKGFQPLQITWGRFIIDAVFRGGKKHSNSGDTVGNAIRHLVGFIRQHYGDVPIIVRADSGFFDQKLFALFEELGIGYVITGKLYKDITAYARAVDPSLWQTHQSRSQEWQYLEFGHRRDSWKRVRRTFYTRPAYEEEQRVLEFARPDNVIITNIGRGEPIDHRLAEAELGDWTQPARILELCHTRGADELVHRALKEFASETLPFKKFDANAAFYYSMLVAFFAYESFKEDVAAPIVPVTARPTRVRRTLLDVAGKLVRTGGEIILKFASAAWKQLRLEEVWARSGSPPRFCPT